MQVKFHWVKFKNLLSYGNSETFIDLASARHTIVTAKNGQGKSSAFLDSICYALYGKPYRNIKLGQLVNSINKKALLCEIEFSVGSDVYRVIRGQKPNIFEIYKNNELILEDAASRDYQAYLETDILKINYKTFKQIIVIGSANYIPFMNLSAAERRNITEEVFDIAIFSVMQDLAKKGVAEYKSQVDSLTYEIQVLKSQIASQKELLETLTVENESKQHDIDIQREDCTKKIKEAQDRIAAIDEQLTGSDDLQSKSSQLSSAFSQVKQKIAKLETKIESLVESKSFYDSDNCPTCGQGIQEDFKKTKQSEVQVAIDDLSSKLTAATGMSTSFETKLESVQTALAEYQKLVYERSSLASAIRRETEVLNSLVKQDSTDSIALCKSKIKSAVESLVEKTDEKNEAAKQLDHYKVSVEVLKDTGIKAKIIATFIPIMNDLINEYLQKFDMFVLFELDENFNETIKSRHRDTFTYNSFSEGEKTRIDLSILFAWRKIAMARNSVSTNLLIFDETLDKSLDDDAVDTFVDILDSVEDTVNTVVVSHRNVVPEMFDRHITIEKVRDFSVLTVN